MVCNNGGIYGFLGAWWVLINMVPCKYYCYYYIAYQVCVISFFSLKQIYMSNVGILRSWGVVLTGRFLKLKTKAKMRPEDTLPPIGQRAKMMAGRPVGFVYVFSSSQNIFWIKQYLVAKKEEKHKQPKQTQERPETMAATAATNAP